MKGLCVGICSTMYKFHFLTYHNKSCFGVTKRLLGDKNVPIQVVELINAFRNRGHFAANLDPLRKGRAASWLPDNVDEYPDVVTVLRNYPESIDLHPFQLHDIDPHKTILDFSGNDIYERFHNLTVSELVNQLVDCYCGSVGVEFAHIENIKQKRWLESKIETELGPQKWSSCNTDEEKRRVLHFLIRSDTMAAFLNIKFPSSKVFGIEGCESLIPGLHGVLEAASVQGLESVEMGMAHRGRMNVLVNFFMKSITSICNNFNETEPSELGDVKYHLGTRSQLKVRGTDNITRTIKLSLSANPSHLEAVNPVVIGKTKAKQFYLQDLTKQRVMPVLLHGDAAFSGQGIVSEVMELSNLDDYTVGGCVHIIINNLIGFTTDPRLARTSYHCTSVAKGVGAPIFHVNGDDVEAVVAVCRLAGEWRQTFRRDCIVDIVCYRRHGHNSQDDPSITQPHVYKLIETHPTILSIYTEKLIQHHSHIISNTQQVEEMKAVVASEYESEYNQSKSYKPDPLEWLASNWQGEAVGSLLSGRPYNQTGVNMSTLLKVAQGLITVPCDFILHKDIEKLIMTRKKILETGVGVTMSFAESLAFGCLMSKYSPNSNNNTTNNKNCFETVNGSNNNHDNQSVVSNSNRSSSISNNSINDNINNNNNTNTTNTSVLDVQMQAHPTVHIRLSGQDCIRGTFNQRHAAITCQATNRTYWPLNNLDVDEQASISVCNSTLSEAAILGFEYGYSLSNDNALTIWEAQFGDFANVAQSLIDNFIVSGESKWSNKSSLVMLLPHGYDGQGPEHSSARLERFLQLVDDDCDAIPGKGSYSEADIEAGFIALSSTTAANATASSSSKNGISSSSSGSNSSSSSRNDNSINNNSNNKLSGDSTLISTVSSSGIVASDDDIGNANNDNNNTSNNSSSNNHDNNNNINTNNNNSDSNSGSTAKSNTMESSNNNNYTSKNSTSIDCNRAKITKDAFTRAVKRYAAPTAISTATDTTHSGEQQQYQQSTNERIDLSLAEIISEHDQLHFENQHQPSSSSSFITDKLNSTSSTAEGSTRVTAAEGVALELTREGWRRLMISWLQTNSERRHNLIVVVPSTPAQYFHCLRRQIHRPFAKPLVVMSAKWLLHHKPCTSRLDDLSEGTFFQRLIIEGGKGDNMNNTNTIMMKDNDASSSSSSSSLNSSSSSSSPSSSVLVEPHLMRKVVFCSGAVFYHLYHARTAAKIRDVTLIRLEQIAPFPYDLVGPAIKRYNPQAELIWAQEEPKNMGAWAYVKPRFDTTCREEGIDNNRSIRYIGRRPAASPATGGYKQHAREQKEFIDEVLSTLS